MKETQIIAIRHGETQWNTERRWQGHSNSPLTEKGLDQAKAVAKRLGDYPFTCLYSSDLGRALQTAEQISKTSGQEVAVDFRLRERNLGIFEGLTEPEMKSKYPDIYSQHQKRDPDYQLPDGESIKQRYERSIEFFNESAKRHPGETIVIITHGGVLDGFFRHAVGLALKSSRMFRVWNAGINIFSYKESGVELLSFGDISHLKNVGSLDDV